MALTTKSGKAVFPIGVGTWLIAGGYELNPEEKYKGAYAIRGNEDEEIEAIRYSISKGQNHIDCAELYGAFYTDEVVGRALVGQTREDLFIADKLWKSSVGPGLVRPTVEAMLDKLGIAYLDLLYIHFPWDEVDWTAAIPQIDELLDDGLIRHFGVSNFTIEQMEQAMAIAKHPITANQMHYNVLDKTEVDGAFREFCDQHDIAIVAYQPVKRKAVFDNGVIQAIAQAHNATSAQVAIAWLIKKGTLPIPKAVVIQHIDENVAANRLVLTDDDMKRLDEL